MGNGNKNKTKNSENINEIYEPFLELELNSDIESASEVCTKKSDSEDGDLEDDDKSDCSSNCVTDIPKNVMYYLLHDIGISNYKKTILKNEIKIKNEIDLETDDNIKYFKMGILYFFKKKMDLAETYLLKIYKDDLENDIFMGDVTMYLGLLYTSQDYFKKAIEFLKISYYKHKTYRAGVFLGKIYILLKKFKIAKKLYTDQIKNGHHESSGHMGILRLFAYFTNYYDEDNDESDGSFNDNSDIAINYFKDAVDAGFKQFYFHIGYIFNELGYKKRAIKNYLLAIKHGEFAACVDLANIYLKMGHDDLYNKYIQKGIENGDVSSIYQEALKKEEDENYEESLKYYSMLREKNDSIYLYMACLYNKLNDKEMASVCLSNIENPHSITDIYFTR